jgi:hypothetical protein
MSATVEDVGSGGADCEFYGEEGELAVFEQAAMSAFPSVATFRRNQSSVS